MKKYMILCTVLLSCLVACDNVPEELASEKKISNMELNIPVEGFEIIRTRTHQLEVSVFPEDAADAEYVWVSSHPDIVSVSETGVMTALQEGEAIVGAALSNGRKRAVAKILVTPYIAENPIKSIVLNKTEHEFSSVADGALKLDATLEPTNPNEPITLETLKWSSDNMFVVQVSEDGTVKIIGGGQATVRCAAVDGGNAFAECRFTVPGTEIKDLYYDCTGAQFDDGYYKKTYDQVEIEMPVLDNTGRRTGKTEKRVWLDRNLGASRRAQSFDDALAYGSFFQWSRKADGHEKIIWDSETPVVTSVSNEKAKDRTDAGHSYFIGVTGDWAGNYPEGLWGGKVFTLPSTGTVTEEQLESMKYSAPLDDASQANNPCPYGYRIPSVYEWHQLIAAMAGLEQIVYNKAGTASIPNCGKIMVETPPYLLFPGNRPNTGDGLTMSNMGVWIMHWSNSSQNANNAWPMRCQITGGNTRVYAQQKANAYPVRCIKDSVK